MPTRSWLIGIAIASAVLAACGGGDSGGALFQDGGAGAGGTGGGAGASSGGSAGSSGTGASSGSGGTGASSGSGGTSGSSGAAGTDGGAGTSGSGGTSGSAGASGAAGTGGSPGCTSSSDCPSGQFCQPGFGCVPGEICATKDQCVQKLGGDACKTSIDCDGATSLCTWLPLDKDHDGHLPIVCGGDDCNDANPDVYTGHPEVCDGSDNDCNGPIDDGATCSGLLVCQGGACTCPAANACGANCVDKQTDHDNCGTCGHACDSAATCQSGQCVCDANATDCGGACVDTTSDDAHCGNCATQCPSGATCQASKCVCSGSQTLCGNACVDTDTDPQNCGGCNTPCNGVCQGGKCTACTVADIYIEMDTTGSMADDSAGGTTTPTRLDYVKSGINTFLGQAANAGMGIGIGFFPVEISPVPSSCTTDAECGGAASSCFFNVCYATDQCSVTPYTTPTIDIAAMPGVASSITAQVNAQVSGGGTPLAVLSGALTFAKSHAQANPTHKTAVVLIADGLPNECTGFTTTPADYTTTANAYATGSPPIKTYVIGVGNTANAQTPAEWNQVASAGGTGTAYIANTAANVATALASIRSAFKTCP